ncbi:pitrilysin family protein [Aliiglaciecola sp. CAU 1673]|uniref:M16 family metallopeptidase n=1 Tax=Aliiglaciecola sp. CAU 1673 TaxID=3032595 RepID=UPI0023D982B3|nr:pitrilysin family protein [Aliiglaciecola sp. CAU 1673]MDF2179747.1 pitrilysin family protein [Aliiglaciecola sp. CAU 1673]
MKTIFKTLIASAAFAPALLWAGEFTLPAYEKHQLDNGLTLYTLEQHEVPLVDLVLVVKSGAVLDDKPGQAKLTAASLLLGTQALDKAAFESKLEFVGATITADADLESSILSASFASKDQAMVMQLVRDAILTPAFDQDEFDKLKQRYTATLMQKTESPKAVIKDYFNDLLFQGHAYSALVDGSKDSVESIGLQDLKDFHQAWFRPDNAALIVTGDIDSKKIKQQVQALFANWQGQAKQKPLLAKPSTPTKTKVLLVDKPDAIESTFMIGGPGVDRNNPDYVAIQVVNTILGGRFTSWLNDELRVNAGLTYGARSQFDSLGMGGSFYMSTFTKTETTKEAMELALKTYNKLWSQGIDAATLASAKAYVKGQFPPKYETSGQLANLLAEMFVYGFDENFINSFSVKVNSLNTEKAKDIIHHYFPRENLQTVVVGKADAIKDAVATFGELEQRSIQ